jgi:hypothetical protein
VERMRNMGYKSSPRNQSSLKLRLAPPKEIKNLLKKVGFLIFLDILASFDNF